MKRVYRNLMFFSLSGLMCLFLAVPAYAQHSHGGGGHSSGGGGGHSYGGGGGHSSYSAPRSNGGGRTAYASRGNAYRGNTNRGNTYNRNVNVNRNVRTNSVNSYRGGAYGRTAYAGHAGVGAYGRGNYAGHAGFYHPGGYRGGLYHPGYWGGGYRGYGWGGRFGLGGFLWYGGFYNSLYWPRLGFSVGFLPYGYYPFYWGGLQFYYSDGYYYNNDNGQYTVVEPPVGAQINTLPSGAKSIVINGQQYYELNGVYYVAVTKDDGSLAYEIAGKDGELNTDGGGDDQNQNAAPPANGDQGYNNAPAPQQQPDVQPAPQRNGSADLQLGDMVQSLPTDSRGVTVNGQRLFVSPDDVYYKATRDNNGNIAYKIVGLPSEAPDNQ